MKPVVAIVGRPNVGKSTLFNWLSRDRKAVIEETPGVTRDRNYAEVFYKGRSFLLVDTGGFDPSADTDPVKTLVHEQTQLAIEEAELVLFVTDGKDGLTPLDLEVAKRLREEGKPFIHVVNKVERKKEREGLWEFYRVGEEPLPVSAKYNQGLKELRQRLWELLPFSPPEPPFQGIRIAVVGRPNVGKSSLVNALIGSPRMIVNEHPGTTRDAVDTLLEREGKRYLLVDTAGIRRKACISERLERYCVMRALRSVDQSDVVLHLIDALEGVTEQDCKLAGYVEEKGKASVVVVNRWDLVERKEKLKAPFVEYVRRRLRFVDFLPVVFTSALTGEGLGELFPKVEEVFASYSRSFSRRELEALVKEVKSLPGCKGKRVRLYGLRQVGIKPPVFIAYTSSEEVPLSSRRYLQHVIRGKLNLMGTPLKVRFKVGQPSSSSATARKASK